MKPSQLAGQLRRIASAIDNSKSPDRGLVTKDIRRVLLAMDPEDQGQSNGNTAGPIDWMKKKKKDYDDNKKLDDDDEAHYKKVEQATDKNASPEILAKLADDEHCNIRSDVADNRNTSPEILAKLADDDEFLVRCHVAMNSNTPPEILAKLADDDSEDVRERVAHNPNTPPEILAKLADDDSEDVRKQLALNKKLPPEIKAKLASVLRMKPSQLAGQLRRIASAIDNSKSPDRTLVARDLKKILAAVSRVASNGMRARVKNGKVVGIDVDVNGKTVFIDWQCNADGKPDRSGDPVAFALPDAWSVCYAKTIRHADGSYEIDPDYLPYIPGSSDETPSHYYEGESGFLPGILLASKHPKAHFEHGWKKAHPNYQIKTNEGKVLFDEDYYYKVWFLMSDVDNIDEVNALMVHTS